MLYHHAPGSTISQLSLPRLQGPDCGAIGHACITTKQKRADEVWGLLYCVGACRKQIPKIIASFYHQHRPCGFWMNQWIAQACDTWISTNVCMLEFSCQTSASLRCCAVRLATCKKKALPRLEKVYFFEDTSMRPASRRKWKAGNGILPISFPPFVSRSTGQTKQSSMLMASNFCKSPRPNRCHLASRFALKGDSSGPIPDKQAKIERDNQ